ncbi:MAG: DUF1624 domain-containing protein [Candidatus Lokiarchaeota archaeon]|nr:DUF1624 domain-containing protein [Candidatus Lokiarchaeota archaeon]
MSQTERNKGHVEKNDNDIKKNKKGKTKRVLALDVLKGIAIILVVLSHVAYFILRPEDIWLYWSIYILLDVFGPSLFVFLSAQGVVFSLTKKKTDYFDAKAVRKTTFRRAYAIIAIGWVYNLFINLVNPIINYGPLSFWYWHILQFIGFSQIFTYIALKCKPYQRIIITFVIFAVSYPLFDFITAQITASGLDFRRLGIGDLSNPFALIYFLIFEPFFLSPLLPWLAYPFISSIVGEWLVKAVEDGSLKAKLAFTKKILIVGIIMTLTGILTGLGRVTWDYSRQNLWETIVVDSVRWDWLDWYWNDGIPLFLVHGTLQFMIYNLGMAILLVAVTFYITEIRDVRGKPAQLLSFYGRTSLSIFIYHQLFALILPFKVGPALMFLIWIIVTILTGAIIAALVFKAKGKGTLEYIVIAAGGLKRVKEKYKAKQELQDQQEPKEENS